MELPQLRYTLCFLTRGADVLMLHRRKAPNLGLWNGVGGHIEAGELPAAACLREVMEETGFVLPQVHFAGLVTWEGFEVSNGGLYVFTAEAPAGEPVSGDEGELQWMPRVWVFSAPQVVSNIHIFGPQVLNGTPAQEYHFVYANGEMLHHETRPLPQGLRVA